MKLKISRSSFLLVKESCTHLLKMAPWRNVSIMKSRQYTRSGYEAFERKPLVDFEEAEEQKFADIGGHQDFVVVDAEVPDNRIQKDEDGNPVNAPFTLNGELVQLTEQGLLLPQ